MIRLADPWYLLVLLLVAVLIWRTWFARTRVATLFYSRVGHLRGLPRSPWVRLRRLPVVLLALAIACLTLALARPQSGQKEEEILTEGIDILLTIDTSGSMKAEDFKPRNRLGVAKDVVAEFIQGRRNDKIGMVVFAAHAFTKCPLTLDYGVLLDLLDDVEIATRSQSTAIGMALATAVNRLKDSTEKSKVVILLTDGRNNAGRINPVDAARLAKALDIKVYTIGVGTKGAAPVPVDDPVFGRNYQYVRFDLDEETLRAIAAETGGQYFRATNADTLKRVFALIDELEKTEIRVKEYLRYTELFPYLLWPGLGCFLAAVLLGGTKLQTLP